MAEESVPVPLGPGLIKEGSNALAAVTFVSNTGQRLAVVYNDGSVALADGLTLDDAAKEAAMVFWKLFGNTLKQKLADRG